MDYMSVFIEVLPILINVWISEVFAYSELLFTKEDLFGVDTGLLEAIWIFNTMNSGAASLLITGLHDILAGHTVSSIFLIAIAVFLFSGAFSISRRTRPFFVKRRNRVIFYFGLAAIIIVDAFLAP